MGWKGWIATGWLLVGLTAGAQPDPDRIGQEALQIPRSATLHTDSLSGWIRTHFSSADAQTRALYTWVVQHIAYSRDSLYYFRNQGTDPQFRMNQILRRRKGVCENYAELLVYLFRRCGINAVMVTGYTRLNGALDPAGHGWAAVETAGGWRLCDPTWDAGRTAPYRYYLATPETFIETHMPFDPLWQLLEQPWTHEDFRKGYAKTKDPRTIFHVNDSVRAYLQADTLQQLRDAARRMMAAGLPNDDLRVWYQYQQMKIHIVLQEENMNLFNGAVADLNAAKKLFNEFVAFRNNRFQPSRPDAEIRSMFIRIEDLLGSAYRQWEGIGLKAENYQYDAEGLRENLDRLAARVQEQRQFLQQYFETEPAARIRLLYP